MSGPLVSDLVSPLDTSQPREPSRPRRLLGNILGWSWRLLAGTFLCFNLPVLSWVTSVLVVGWLQRWVRARVLFAWWSRSPVRDQVSFDEVGETRRDGSPVILPRWLLPEKEWPHCALWLNFKTGLATLLCVYLLLGFSGLVMHHAWELGWRLFSWHGDAEATVAVLAPLLGVVPFMLGFLYLPLARVHAAVVGEASAFFNARLIWRLIWARPMAFTWLILLIVLASLPLDVMNILPLSLDREDATDAEALDAVMAHLRTTALVLFVTLLFIDAWAARIYSLALGTALRQGTLEPADLGPRLYLIRKHLGLLPDQEEGKCGLGRILRWTWRYYTTRILLAAMLLLAFVFVGKIYYVEATVAHPFVGFMNHPLLQFPCVDYVPRHLLR